MKWRFQSLPIEKITGDLLVIPVATPAPLYQQVPEPLEGPLAAYEKQWAKGPVQAEWFSPHAGPGGMAVYLQSPQSCKGLPAAEAMKTLAGQALEFARRRELRRLVFLINGPAGASAALDLLEGCLLGAYRFDRYLSSPQAGKTMEAVFVIASDVLKPLKQQAQRRAAVVEGVNLARDLVNEPPDVVTPEALARRARAMSRDGGLTCSVWNEKKLREKGANGLLTVGAGSQYPPRLITMEYAPTGKRASQTHLCLVGKGITFDTGGVSLKGSAGMWRMKGDMAGAAATLGAMQVVSALKPSIRVSGIVVAACNAVDARANLPGQIFQASNGKTIHVDNTDAEGRLVLTDGLFQAGRLGATHVVDIATLTGSIVQTLGTAVSGLFCDDAPLRDALIQSAAASGDAVWPMPMIEEYRKYLECSFADLNNIRNDGDRAAGAILAALFLREFAPEGAAWAHLDIAGTYMTESSARPWKYFQPGATGAGVRLLGALIEALEQQ